MSIRIRLVVWYSSLFAVSLASFAILVWLGTRSLVRDDINTWLARQADGLEQFLKKETHGTGEAAVIEETREFSSGLPVGSGVRLFNREGRLLISRPEGQPGVYSEVSGEVSIGGEHFRFELWRSTAESETALNDLRRVLILLVPVFLVVSVAGGWFLGRHAFRPVDEITAAARKISLEDLSVQLPVPPHRDELQRLCEAWNGMLRRLDNSARQLRQFTADASHELRTPVALIRTTAELALRKERSESEYRASLSRIQEEAEELTSSIESLMDLARADSGQSEFVMDFLDIRELVEDIRPQVELLASESNLDFKLRSEPNLPRIWGDRKALRRVLLILLDNAVKFTPATGRVELRVSVEGAEVIIEVDDTGIGIANQDLVRVFDRFYQVDQARSGGGVGLGLSIARCIVQGHKGRIGAESKPGSGSIFRVVLPAVG